MPNPPQPAPDPVQDTGAGVGPLGGDSSGGESMGARLRGRSPVRRGPAPPAFRVDLSPSPVTSPDGSDHPPAGGDDNPQPGTAPDAVSGAAAAVGAAAADGAAAALPGLERPEAAAGHDRADLPNPDPSARETSGWVDYRRQGWWGGWEEEVDEPFPFSGSRPANRGREDTGVWTERSRNWQEAGAQNPSTDFYGDSTWMTKKREARISKAMTATLKHGRNLEEERFDRNYWLPFVDFMASKAIRDAWVTQAEAEEVVRLSA